LKNKVPARNRKFFQQHIALCQKLNGRLIIGTKLKWKLLKSVFDPHDQIEPHVDVLLISVESFSNEVVSVVISAVKPSAVKPIPGIGG